MSEKCKFQYEAFLVRRAVWVVMSVCLKHEGVRFHEFKMPNELRCISGERVCDVLSPHMRRDFSAAPPVLRARMRAIDCSNWDLEDEKKLSQMARAAGFEV